MFLPLCFKFYVVIYYVCSQQSLPMYLFEKGEESFDDNVLSLKESLPQKSLGLKSTLVSTGGEGLN